MVVVAIIAAGHANATPFSTIFPGEEIDSEEALFLNRIHEDLLGFKAFTTDQITQGEQAFNDNKASRKERKAFKEWQQLCERFSSRTFEQDEALPQLIDTWAWAAQLLDYTLGDDAAQVFGKQHAYMIGLSYRIYTRIEWIAEQHLPPEALAHTERKIEDYVRAYPLKDTDTKNNRFFDFDNRLFSGVRMGSDALSTLAKIPLAPFRLNDSLKTGSESMAQISSTAERFTDVIATMPEQLTQRFVSILERLEGNHEGILTLLERMENITVNAKDAMTQADQVTSGVQTTVASVHAMLPESQALIDQAHATAAELNQLVAGLQALQSAQLESRAMDNDKPAFVIEAYAETARAIETGAEEVTRLIESLDRFVAAQREHKRTPGKKPFDILEYKQTADAIEQGAARLQELIVTLETSSQSEHWQELTRQIDAQAQSLVNKSEASARGLINEIFWRLAALIGLALLCLILYRVLAHRFWSKSGQ